MFLEGIGVRFLHWKRRAAYSVNIKRASFEKGWQSTKCSKNEEPEVYGRPCSYSYPQTDDDTGVRLVSIRHVPTNWNLDGSLCAERLSSRENGFRGQEIRAEESQDILGDTYVIESLSGFNKQQSHHESYHFSVNFERCFSATTNTSDYLVDYDRDYFLIGLRAASAGDLPKLEYSIVKLGVPVNAQTVDGLTMLHNAIRGDHLECVKFLMQYGADIRKMTARGRTAVHIAARSSAALSLKLILLRLCNEEKMRSNKLNGLFGKSQDRYSFLLVGDENGDTPLHLACRQRSKRCLKMLMQCIIKYVGWPAAEEALQERNKLSQAPLHVSCMWRSLEAAEILLTSECTKMITDVCPYMKKKKISKALRFASISTLKWEIRMGSLLFELAAIKCSCPDETASFLSQRTSPAGGERLSFQGQAQYTDDDVDLPERRCQSCDRVLTAVVTLLHAQCPQLVHLRGKKGQTALVYAVIHDAVGVVSALLAAGVDIEATDLNNRTALHHAASYGVSRQVAMLLSHGASPSQQDFRGATPMHYAALRAYTSCLRSLYQANKLTDVKNANGHTAFMWAAMHGVDLSLITMLEANPVLSRQERDSAGRTALHLAAANDHFETVKVLVRSGFDAEEKNSKGQTALLVAASCGCVNAVHSLLDCGADIFSLDKDGNSALHLASRSDSSHEILLELLTWLQDHSVLNLRNSQNKTPLHCAVEGNAVSCVRSLVQNGADIHVRDFRGRDAMMVATERGFWPILTILAKSSPNVNCYSSFEGHSTLSLALEQHNFALGSFLRTSGAKMPREIVVDAAQKIQRWYRSRMFMRRLISSPEKKGRNVLRICTILGESMVDAGAAVANARFVTLNKTIAC